VFVRGGNPRRQSYLASPKKPLGQAVVAVTGRNREGKMTLLWMGEMMKTPCLMEAHGTWGLNQMETGRELLR